MIHTRNQVAVSGHISFCTFPKNASNGRSANFPYSSIHFCCRLSSVLWIGDVPLPSIFNLAIMFSLVSVTTACAQQTPQKEFIDIDLDTPFQLAIQETAKVSDLVKIEFLSVLEDSRCPKGVHCIWAGQAKVVLGVTLPSQPTQKIKFTLSDGGKEAKKALGGYGIQLHLLEPYPVGQHPIDPNNYHLSLTISQL